MSLHISLVAIEGSWIDRLPHFFEGQEYTIYTLGEEAMGSATSSPSTPSKQADSKPWWKFW